MSDREIREENYPEERPPLGSWALIYLLEFVNLALLVLFFYLLTKTFE